jgi:hypothetical protein
MTNLDIDKIMKTYNKKYKDFKYVGTIINYDFKSFENIDLTKIKQNKLGLISYYVAHWVALFIDKINNEITYFDSVANPPFKEIKKLIKIYKNQMNNPKIIINKIQYQKKDGYCGPWCIAFIKSKILDKPIQKVE